MTIRNTILTLVSFIFLLGGSLSAQDLKIATVDGNRLFSEYYKAKEALEGLKRDSESIRAELENMMSQGEKEVEAAKEIQERLNNPMLNDAAKAEAEKEYREKVMAIKRLESDVQNFKVQSDRQISQRQQNQRDYLFEEIKTVVVDYAEANDLDLVFDASSSMMLGLPSVVHADSRFDITDEILTTLNADAPAAE